MADVSGGRIYVKSGFAVAGPVATGRAVMREPRPRPPRIVAPPARRPRTSRRSRRTSRTSHGPPGREDPTDDDLAARLAGVLAKLGPLPASAHAAQVRRRRATVLETLHGDGRFAWSGKRRSSRWSLADPVRSSTWDNVPVVPVAFRDAVWRARSHGALDGIEAIELFLEQPPEVLAMLAEVAA